MDVILEKAAMKLSTFLLAENKGIPNNKDLPVLVYHNVFEDDTEDQFKSSFSKNKWKGIWVNGVFDYHHYHSSAHEALGVAGGNGTLVLGGPGGKEVVVRKGDMLILPAGTGHCLKKSSDNFRVVGAYPAGQEDYDICTQKDNVASKKANIRKVSKPSNDPVFGAEGPLADHWNR